VRHRGPSKSPYARGAWLAAPKQLGCRAAGCARPPRPSLTLRLHACGPGVAEDRRRRSAVYTLYIRLDSWQLIYTYSNRLKSRPPSVKMRPVKKETRKTSAPAAGSVAPSSSDRIALPSDRLRPPLSSPFLLPSRAATPFSAAHASGRIPCRIQHGSIRATLLWDMPPAELLRTDGGAPFVGARTDEPANVERRNRVLTKTCMRASALLLLVADGLRETQHPHAFVAREAFATLLAEPGAGTLAAGTLSQLSAPLRAALSAAEAGVLAAACLAVEQLAVCVGAPLLSILSSIVVPLGKLLDSPGQRPAARAALAAIVQSCGPAALPLLRAKLPRYEG